jgi:hypothetical protein
LEFLHVRCFNVSTVLLVINYYFYLIILFFYVFIFLITFQVYKMFLLTCLLLVAASSSLQVAAETLSERIASAEANITSVTTNLREWNTFYAEFAETVSELELSQCNASSMDYLAARTTAGCGIDQTFDVDTICNSTNATAPITACCQTNDSGDQIYVNATDANCKEFYDLDSYKNCCLFCTSPTYGPSYGMGYPYDNCHTDEAFEYVSVSLCESPNNTEAIEPLPAGWDCSATTIGIGEMDNNTDASCDLLDAWFAAGRSGASFGRDYVDNVGWVGKLLDEAHWVDEAVVNGGALYVASQTGCAVFTRPKLNGHFITYLDGGNVNTTLDLRIYDPYVYPTQEFPYGNGNESAAEFKVLVGDATVVAGTVALTGIINIQTAGEVKIQGLSNWGDVAVNSAPSSMHLADIVNDGTVVFVGTESVTMQNIDNSGSVSVTNLTVSATGSCVAPADTVAFNFVLLEVENSGNVSFSGGSVLLYDVMTSASSTVSVADGCFVLVEIENAGTLTFENGDAAIYNVTNSGDVHMVAGSAVVTRLVNNGTITIDAGAIDITISDNAGGTIVAASGVTGTVTYLDGATCGTVTVESGVTLVGSCSSFSPGDDDDFYGDDDDFYGDDDDAASSTANFGSAWITLMAAAVTLCL